MVVGIGALGHLQPAEQHGARLAQSADDTGVLAWLEVDVDCRARCSWCASGPEEVLDGQWNGMPAATTGDDVRPRRPKLASLPSTAAIRSS
jgi:hypothetical protein